MKFSSLIYVSDLQKSIAFYTETLGFKLGEFYPNKEDTTYASVFIGEDKLRLCLARESNKKFSPKGLGGSGVQFFGYCQAVCVNPSFLSLLPGKYFSQRICKST